MAARSFLAMVQRKMRFAGYTLVLDDNWASRRTALAWAPASPATSSPTAVICKAARSRGFGDGAAMLLDKFLAVGIYSLVNPATQPCRQLAVELK